MVEFGFGYKSWRKKCKRFTIALVIVADDFRDNVIVLAMMDDFYKKIMSLNMNKMNNFSYTGR